MRLADSVCPSIPAFLLYGVQPKSLSGFVLIDGGASLGALPHVTFGAADISNEIVEPGANALWPNHGFVTGAPFTFSASTYRDANDALGAETVIGAPLVRMLARGNSGEPVTYSGAPGVVG